MLLAFGAALSGIALLSSAKTSSYLAVARQYRSAARSRGRPHHRAAARGSGLDPIPASQLGAVVGLHAATSLLPAPCWPPVN